MFGPTTQTRSCTEMLVDGFQQKQVRLRGDHLKMVEECLCFCVRSRKTNGKSTCRMFGCEFFLLILNVHFQSMFIWGSDTQNHGLVSTSVYAVTIRYIFISVHLWFIRLNKCKKLPT